MFEILRVLALDLDPATVRRMCESKRHGVQPLALEAEPFGKSRVRAVSQVAAARMAQRRKVDTDLVCATGFEVHVQQTRCLERLDGVVVRDAGLAVGRDRESPVVPVMASDGRVDRSAARVGGCPCTRA